MDYEFSITLVLKGLEVFIVYLFNTFIVSISQIVVVKSGPTA